MAVSAILRGLVVVGAAVVAVSCAPPREPAPRPATVEIPPAPSASAPAPAREPAATVVADDAPLGDGLQTFRGVVRPTKGGLDVRGVLLEDDALPRALGPAGGEPLLGARVEVTADLVRHEAPSAPPPDGVAVQMRSGSWLGVRRVERATIVASPVVIEGAIHRSKGLLAVGDHLVSHRDLDWSLAAAGGWKAGDRVRLWGQPRVVRCGPHEQCLIGGTIPMFDVGRAEKLAP